MSTLRVRIRPAQFLLIASLSTSFPVEASAQASGVCDANGVSSTLKEIASEKPGLHRYETAGDLAVHMKKLGPRCVTSNDIAVLISLMRDKDNSVRFWAAGMIGNLDAAGRAAIPALKAALAERPCEDGAVTAAAAIRYALRKLGENPAPAPSDCRGLAG